MNVLAKSLAEQASSLVDDVIESRNGLATMIDPGYGIGGLLTAVELLSRAVKELADAS